MQGAGSAWLLFAAPVTGLLVPDTADPAPRGIPDRAQTAGDLADLESRKGPVTLAIARPSRAVT